jgi:hypothetical protein
MPYICEISRVSKGFGDTYPFVVDINAGEMIIMPNEERNRILNLIEGLKGEIYEKQNEIEDIEGDIAHIEGQIEAWKARLPEEEK